MWSGMSCTGAGHTNLPPDSRFDRSSIDDGNHSVGCRTVMQEATEVSLKRMITRTAIIARVHRPRGWAGHRVRNVCTGRGGEEAQRSKMPYFERRTRVTKPVCPLSAVAARLHADLHAQSCNIIAGLARFQWWAGAYTDRDSFHFKARRRSR